MKGIVWGLNRPFCDGRLNKLITEYELFWNIKPKKIRQSQQTYEVEFENGDIWMAGTSLDRMEKSRPVGNG